MIFDYIKAAKFFPTYCPEIKNWKHKLRGKSGKNVDISFTPEEIKQIKKGLVKLHKDLQKRQL